MFIRVIARVLELNEDFILQNIEPTPTFIWATKYIKSDGIDYFEALGDKKTVLFMYEGSPIIIKENIDLFYERLAEVQKQDNRKDDLEDEISVILEEEDEDEDK